MARLAVSRVRSSRASTQSSESRAAWGRGRFQEADSEGNSLRSAWRNMGVHLSRMGRGSGRTESAKAAPGRSTARPGETYRWRFAFSGKLLEQVLRKLGERASVEPVGHGADPGSPQVPRPCRSQGVRDISAARGVNGDRAAAR